MELRVVVCDHLDVGVRPPAQCGASTPLYVAEAAGWVRGSHADLCPRHAGVQRLQGGD